MSCFGNNVGGAGDRYYADPVVAGVQNNNWYGDDNELEPAFLNSRQGCVKPIRCSCFPLGNGFFFCQCRKKFFGRNGGVPI